jgi:nucleoside-diphosphate-sugar epimerase
MVPSRATKFMMTRMLMPSTAVPDDAMHRQIDLTIIRAREGLGEKAKLVIMIPPAIYGFNPKHKRLSIQIPTITRFALKHGFAGHVGKGLSVESQIHVLDLARAYIVLLHHMETSPPGEFLQNPYFFCENGKEFSWKEVAGEVGKALYEQSLIKDAAPREFGEEHGEDLFGEYTAGVLGLNSRSRAVRLRQLGWEAREKGIWESFREDELPEILKEEG